MKINNSIKIIIRYSLLQLPGIVLFIAALIFIQHWIILKDAVFWGLILLWITKDVILFFYTSRAYDWDPKDPMVGIRGIALEKIITRGYIMVNGERWHAVNEGQDPIEKGQEVHISKRKGLTLYINI